MAQSSRGFSLIEILVALVLLATFGLSIQDLLTQLATQRIRVADVKIADRVAMNAALRGLLIDQKKLSNDVDGSEMRRQLEVEARGEIWRVSYTSEQTLLGDLERVTVTATPKTMSSGSREVVYYQ